MSLSCVSAVTPEGKGVFLKDIWPTREEIQEVEHQFVIPAMFKEVYTKVEVHQLAVPDEICRPALFG